MLAQEAEDEPPGLKPTSPYQGCSKDPWVEIWSEEANPSCPLINSWLGATSPLPPSSEQLKSVSHFCAALKYSESHGASPGAKKKGRLGESDTRGTPPCAFPFIPLKTAPKRVNKRARQGSMAWGPFLRLRTRRVGAFCVRSVVYAQTLGALTPSDAERLAGTCLAASFLLNGTCCNQPSAK